MNGVEWDAVELPSQFMENWCYHRPTLMGMTAHFRDRRTSPGGAVSETVRRGRFRARFRHAEAMAFGMTDLELHTVRSAWPRIDLRRPAAHHGQSRPCYPCCRTAVRCARSSTSFPAATRPVITATNGRRC
ncbi:MAG: M3 family metallopeptidase [Planctomycetaceae bacterium]